MKDEDAWFAPKVFGYGSGLPIAWQGWAVLASYTGIMLAAAALCLPDHPFAFAASLLIATTVLLAICASKTRGGWRWRRGGAD